MSGGHLCEAQIEREARRIFRKMLTRGAHIGACEEGTDFALFVSERARKRSYLIEAEVMREFLARDWLRGRGTTPESWRLSSAGEGWYLRHQAASEPYAAQHQARVTKLIETETGTRRVLFNEGESPLGWLKRRRLIAPAHFEAGERLRRDFTLAQLTPRLGVDLSVPIVLGQRGAKSDSNLSDTVLDAERRFGRAMAAVGPGLSDILFDVCCHLSRLEEIENAKDWPRRSAKVVLDIALERLARHYGMVVTGRPHARMRAWAAEPAE
jgi:hypothetical protein